jgi:hypothetical protein
MENKNKENNIMPLNESTKQREQQEIKSTDTSLPCPFPMLHERKRTKADTLYRERVYMHSELIVRMI